MSEPTPNAQATGSSWTAFLKSIASFNGDLSSLTAPPFILSSTSLTEFSSYWCEHPSVFAAPAKEPDPAKRALLVLKWFLTTLKQQYASRSEQYGNEKKPLNPFLGELFLGKWEDDAGTTELISEQGYNAQKATFSKTINIKQLGHAVLTVPDPTQPREKDTYLISLPSIHVEGLIFGAPFIELDSASYITSTTGYTAKIDYSGKGWISGKKNSFTATLYPTGREKDVIYNCSGQWTKAFDIYSGPVKSNSSKTLIESWDPTDNPVSELIIAPIEKQHPLESRRAWASVASGITKGDMDLVGREKGKIEHAQRAMRKKEQAEGREWERRYFTALAEPDDTLEILAPIVGLNTNGDSDKTGGLWRFDEGKAEKVKDQELSEDEKTALAQELLGQ
ncbi:Oxysterol-binding protein 4 [Parahypoxylon ruwenzoriense]